MLGMCKFDIEYEAKSYWRILNKVPTRDYYTHMKCMQNSILNISKYWRWTKGSNRNKMIDKPLYVAQKI